MKAPKNYTIDEELIKKVKVKSREQRRSESFVVNDILLNYFKKEAKQ